MSGGSFFVYPKEKRRGKRGTKGGTIFQMKEDFLAILFLLIPAFSFFLFFYFIRQTEKCLVSHVLVHSETGIERCSVK